MVTSAFLPSESIIALPGWVDFIMLRRTWNPESNWAGGTSRIRTYNKDVSPEPTPSMSGSFSIKLLSHGGCTGGAAHDSIYDGSSISYRCSNTRLFTSPRRPIRKGRYCQLTKLCHTLSATHTAWWVLWDSNPGLLLYESRVLAN